jgi:hypothetical protein
VSASVVLKAELSADVSWSFVVTWYSAAEEENAKRQHSANTMARDIKNLFINRSLKIKKHFYILILTQGKTKIK